MSSTNGEHPINGPFWFSVITTVGFVLASTQIFHTATPRLLGTGLVIAAAILVWKSFKQPGRAKIVLLGLASICAFAWVILSAVTDSGDSAVPSIQQDGATPALSPTPEPTALSITPTPTPPVATSSTLPKAVRGGDAPVRKLKTGQSSEFFGGSVRVGVANVFDTFASINAQSEDGSCDSIVDIGESFVVAGPDPGGETPHLSTWLRVALLEIDQPFVSLRVERLLSVDPPNYSADC